MSKRRQRRRSCTRKSKFANEGHAASVARKLTGRDGCLVVPYKCSFCNGWHVGRPNRRQKQSRRAKRRR